jgi:DNA-binding transcriptional LysR family regulator
MKALDIEAVQAFVLTSELKSFTRAAEVLDSTQSAISLKVKRLEDSLDRRLLERTSRSVRLSADGEAFLQCARALMAAHQQAIECFTTKKRRLVIGISHHIVGAELPSLLKHMSVADPSIILDVRISTSRDALSDYDKGALDAAIVLRHDNRRKDGYTLFQEDFGWMAAPDFTYRSDEGLRLATQPEPCSVRGMAVSALEQAGIRWHEVFVGGGVLTIGAAVLAGLGVAAMSKRVAPLGTVDVGLRHQLPPLPSRDVVLHSNLTDMQSKNALRSLDAALRATATTR